MLSLAPRRYRVLLFRAFGIQPSNRLFAVVIIGIFVPIRTIPSYKLLVARYSPPTLLVPKALDGTRRGGHKALVLPAVNISTEGPFIRLGRQRGVLQTYRLHGAYEFRLLNTTRRASMVMTVPGRCLRTLTRLLTTAPSHNKLLLAATIQLLPNLRKV